MLIASAVPSLSGNRFPMRGAARRGVPGVALAVSLVMLAIAPLAHGADAAPAPATVAATAATPASAPPTTPSC